MQDVTHPNIDEQGHVCCEYSTNRSTAILFLRVEVALSSVYLDTIKN